MTELNRPQLSVSVPSLAPHQIGQADLPHPACRGSFVASLHGGFSIERARQLPNLGRCCYPPEESLLPGTSISRSCAVGVRINPRTRTSLRGGCGRPPHRCYDEGLRLLGPPGPPWWGYAPNGRGAGRGCRPTARDLPAYPGRTSCRVALADPDGIHDAHGTILTRTCRGHGRAPGYACQRVAAGGRCRGEIDGVTRGNPVKTMGSGRIIAELGLDDTAEELAKRLDRRGHRGP